MRPLHNSLRFIPLLLAGVALAACDQLTDRLPTGTRATTGGAGVAPLMTAGPSAIPGRYVVVMHDAQPGAAGAVAQEVVSAYGGKVHHTYGAALHGFAASLSPAAVEALRRNPRVKYVAEDGTAYLTDTQTGATWGLDRVDQRTLPLNNTYVYERTGAGVRVYVIDSGIRTSHDQFGGRASVGADFVGDGQNGQDCNGHGTHVAGTIAGTTYGVAKAAQVVSVRVFGCGDGAEWSTVIAAVDWVTANAVKPAVVNMSLGGGFYEPMNQAVQSSIASGVVYALAAGNDGYDACWMSPASTPQAITVGATTSGDWRAWFSNWGTCVDLFAPGDGITSAWWHSNTATNTISGTSMAAPHAAGVAALYLEADPTATPAAVAAALTGSSTVGQLSDIGSGSPNRLLFSPLTVQPPAARIALSPTELFFTFVRPIAGGAGATARTAAAPAQQFMAVSGAPPKAGAAAAAGPQATTSSTKSAQVGLQNTGTTALNWDAGSDRPWLSMSPDNGRLTEGYTAILSATASSTGLAAGTHTGTLTVSDPLASNLSGQVSVSVTVIEPTILQVGTPRTGLSGDYGSQRYYAVEVPVGATSLRIATSGGTGDADLFVRWGNLDGWWDCYSGGGSNEDSCQVQSPQPGTYYVMIYGFRAYSGMTLSATSGGPPAAPLNLASRATGPATIHSTWTDGSVNETGFTLSRRTMPAGGTWGAWEDVATPAANAVLFNDTGRVAGDSYQYRLRACNAAGCSAWATGPTVTVPTAPPAPPFALLAAAVSGTAAAVTWTDGSSDETSFELARALRYHDGTWGAYVHIASPAANATSFSNTGLVAGRQYRWQLRACNATGCSAWATSSVLVMPTVPAAPSAVSGAPLSISSIRVQWTDASSTETSFRLERAPVSAAGVVGSYTLAATLAPDRVQYDNTGLAVGSYRYRIRACNAAGCSAWVTTANVVIPPVPTAPTTLVATALSSTSIGLTWVDTGPAETEYKVFRALRNLDGTWTAYTRVARLPADAMLYNSIGLLSGREYRFQVQACNVSGCSAFATSAIVGTP